MAMNEEDNFIPPYGLGGYAADIPSVVHPVPPIEVWNALVAEVESKSTHPYKNIAMNVLSEMRKYVGYSYAIDFKTPRDVERLAIAIQRFVDTREKEQE